MKKIIFLSILSVILTTSYAFAYSMFGDDITIFDGNSNSDGNSWYSNNEDQEVEPGMVGSQAWDLEGFFLKGTTLTMVGGYNFIENNIFIFGDIFIDVNGDAEYGTEIGLSNGNKIVTDTYGYDFVLDLDLDLDSPLDSNNNFNYTVYNFNYTVYELTDDSQTRTAYFKEYAGSNPWQYYSGGTFKEFGTGVYFDGLSDSDVGFEGGYHNAISVDLGFLDDIDNFTAHNTMQCGNDNLMGRISTPTPVLESASMVPTPEPATIFIFGIGLISLAGFGRKTFKKKI